MHQLANHVLGVPDRGVGVFKHSLVVPVEVPPCQGAPVVAHYHTIRVQHRYNLEDECVSQQLVSGGEQAKHNVQKQREGKKVSNIV